ncbi:hypothetical protein IWX81_002443 [Salinibacterium sp. CAN_S4]
MIRTRLFLAVGALLAIAGVGIAAVALLWLATNWGSGQHIYDPDGPLYKQVSMSSFGAIVGMALAVAGVATSTAGLVHRKRMS